MQQPEQEQYAGPEHKEKKRKVVAPIIYIYSYILILLPLYMPFVVQPGRGNFQQFPIAQLIESQAHNPKVQGSTPGLGKNNFLSNSEQWQHVFQ